MAENRTENIKGKLAVLPDLPGVYRFINKDGKVIYVGKAKNLKKRVSSYFVDSRHKENRKLVVLVKNIHDIEHTVVESERDALFLENNLIKTLKPRYNILLKDDKTYPWICIKNEPFPRVFMTRKFVRDGSRYFGPYSSVYIQKQILELIRNVHTIRTCSLNLDPEKIRNGKYSVCLEYHLGNCKGPCVGNQSEEDYGKNISLTADILKGNMKNVINYMTEEMNLAAANMNFELAQKIKNRIEEVRNYQSKTVIVNNALINLDVFALLMEDGNAYSSFMRIKNGAVINSYSIEMELGVEETEEDVLSFAISEFDRQLEGGIQKEILVPFIPNTELFPEKQFSVPKKGDRLKLLELAEKNCRLYRIEKIKYIEKTDPQRHTNRIMSQMQKDLYLDVPPYHIECFDNSNIQGTNPVAACVVFRNGKPSKKEYRHFNIKTVIGPNDFASMEEVIFRRYKRLLEEGGDLPQLIVVDGGKGQLSIAYNTIKRLGLDGRIAIIGLAKRLEEVFYPNDSVPLYLDKNSETLRILMHIRDEAHRFGITFHRQKRSINFIKSELELIPGLGPKTIEKLLKKFKTISKIKSATLEEISEVIGNAKAGAVKEYFPKE
ncbi:MAG: excinuclease ABC subunit UvrC [Rikenellaceae bacterium]|nr:excinuclease ABC subunit UvrC [Rikenellaceae bacterium]